MRRPDWLCCGWWSPWCVLDIVTRCKVQAICDAHDRAIQGGDQWNAHRDGIKDLLGLKSHGLGKPRCRTCGTDDREDIDRPCPHGCCVDFVCSGCGQVHGGMGPAGCDCCEGAP